eukprot:2044380-Lingulodinium_polyedra.AAC.1
MFRQHLETSGIPPTLQALGTSVCRTMGTIAFVVVATDSGVERSIIRRRRPRKARENRENTAEG